MAKLIAKILQYLIPVILGWIWDAIRKLIKDQKIKKAQEKIKESEDLSKSENLNDRLLGNKKSEEVFKSL